MRVDFPGDLSDVAAALEVFAEEARTARREKDLPAKLDGARAAAKKIGTVLVDAVRRGATQEAINAVLAKEQCQVTRWRDRDYPDMPLMFYTAGGSGYGIQTSEPLNLAGWKTREQLFLQAQAKETRAKTYTLTDHADLMRKAATRLAKLSDTSALVGQLRAAAQDLEAKQLQWDEEG